MWAYKIECAEKEAEEIESKTGEYKFLENESVETRIFDGLAHLSWKSGLICSSWVDSNGVRRYDVAFENGKMERNIRAGLIRVRNDWPVLHEDDASYDVGVRVQARLLGKHKWFPGTVVEVINSSRFKRFTVQYDDGTREEAVNPCFLRPLSQAKLEITTTLSKYHIGDKVYARCTPHGMMELGRIVRVGIDRDYDVAFDSGVFGARIDESQITLAEPEVNPNERFYPSQRVLAKYGSTILWYKGTIVRGNKWNSTFDVRFDDGTVQRFLSPDNISPINDEEVVVEEKVHCYVEGELVHVLLDGRDIWLDGTVVCRHEDNTYSVDIYTCSQSVRVPLERIKQAEWETRLQRAKQDRLAVRLAAFLDANERVLCAIGRAMATFDKRNFGYIDVTSFHQVLEYFGITPTYLEHANLLDLHGRHRKKIDYCSFIGDVAFLVRGRDKTDRCVVTSTTNIGTRGRSPVRTCSETVQVRVTSRSRSRSGSPVVRREVNVRVRSTSRSPSPEIHRDLRFRVRSRSPSPVIRGNVNVRVRSRSPSPVIYSGMRVRVRSRSRSRSPSPLSSRRAIQIQGRSLSRSPSPARGRSRVRCEGVSCSRSRSRTGSPCRSPSPSRFCVGKLFPDGIVPVDMIFKTGNRVEVKSYQYGDWCLGRVEAINRDNTFDVLLDCGIAERGIDCYRIRLPVRRPQNAQFRRYQFVDVRNKYGNWNRGIILAIKASNDGVCYDVQLDTEEIITEVEESAIRSFCEKDVSQTFTVSTCNDTVVSRTTEVSSIVVTNTNTRDQQVKDMIHALKNCGYSFLHGCNSPFSCQDAATFDNMLRDLESTLLCRQRPDIKTEQVVMIRSEPVRSEPERLVRMCSPRVQTPVRYEEPRRSERWFFRHGVRLITRPTFQSCTYHSFVVRIPASRGRIPYGGIPLWIGLKGYQGRKSMRFIYPEEGNMIAFSGHETDFGCVLFIGNDSSVVKGECVLRLYGSTGPVVASGAFKITHGEPCEEVELSYNVPEEIQFVCLSDDVELCTKVSSCYDMMGVRTRTETYQEALLRDCTRPLALVMSSNQAARMLNQFPHELQRRDVVVMVEHAGDNANTCDIVRNWRKRGVRSYTINRGELLSGRNDVSVLVQGLLQKPRYRMQTSLRLLRGVGHRKIPPLFVLVPDYIVSKRREILVSGRGGMAQLFNLAREIRPKCTQRHRLIFFCQSDNLERRCTCCRKSNLVHEPLYVELSTSELNEILPAFYFNLKLLSTWTEEQVQSRPLLSNISGFENLRTSDALALLRAIYFAEESTSRLKFARHNEKLFDVIDNAFDDAILACQRDDSVSLANCLSRCRYATHHGLEAMRSLFNRKNPDINLKSVHVDNETVWVCDAHYTDYKTY